MKNVSPLIIALCLLACQKQHEKKEPEKSAPTASVEEQGKKIVFPNDPKTLGFFSTEQVKSENLAAHYTAPASVEVAVIQSAEQGGRNVVLFDNPDLNASYTQFLQHIITINQYKVNLSRMKDLAQHGAATGKEVLEAETQLANEEAAITEQESRLKMAGLDPVRLHNPKRKEAWIICEIPENQIAQVQTGTPCTITFTAFGNEEFKAVVDGIGVEVDNITRMVKVRVVLPNPNNRFEVGMFASATFLLKEGNTISIPVDAVVNVQGKDYAFVKTANSTFERKELLLGQQFDSKIIVLHGLAENDEVVTKNVMQLKGLSFGY